MAGEEICYANVQMCLRQGKRFACATGERSADAEEKGLRWRGERFAGAKVKRFAYANVQMCLWQGKRICLRKCPDVPTAGEKDLLTQMSKCAYGRGRDLLVQMSKCA